MNLPRLVASDGLYLICLFLMGCLPPVELYAALQHTVTRLQIIGHRLHTIYYMLYSHDRYNPSDTHKGGHTWLY